MPEHQLSQGWVISAIQNLISIDGLISDGDWIESKDQDPNGSIRLVQLADIGDGDFRNKSQRFMSEEKASLLNCTFLEEGDVLIARMPDPLGRACLFPGVGQPAVTVVDVCLIRAGLNSAITNHLLKYWINSPSFRGLISENASGTTRKRITRKKLEKFEIPLPPLAEQKVIADKLDTLLAQVENTKARLERIPQILKRFRQSVLAAAVSGRLTEEWREGNATSRTLEEFLKQLETLRQTAIQEENQRTGRKSKYKAVNIDTSGAPAELPESWNWIPVEALAAKVTDGVHKKPTYVSSGVPFITVKNLTKGSGISFSKTNFISEKDHEEFCKRTNPKKGDILISKDGTLGVVRQIRTNRIFSIFVSVALVKPADRRMSDYLEIAFQSPVVQGQMIGVGTGLQHIHLTDLRKDLIPVPPLEEQTEIVRRVDQLFAHTGLIEQQANNALSRVNNLTQSILAKAFRGELTEQWRKDNPDLISGENSAEALLERIKAERAAAKPAKKTRKQTTA